VGELGLCDVELFFPYTYGEIFFISPSASIFILTCANAVKVNARYTMSKENFLSIIME
jgi:hypothetical protein